MKLGKKTIIVFVLFVTVTGAVYHYFVGGSFNLPEGTTKKVQLRDKTIMETENTKHSIPIEEIRSGGPPKDGIPSIDDPKFISTEKADNFLDGNDVGLGIKYRGEARFYPFQIMVWHEIANDEIQGDPVLVTYCPLCFTGIVFERMVEGEVQEFGVSGKLWQSNLLMYNRAPDPSNESLWSQVLGEAVVGPHTGTKLNIIPSDIVEYGNWKDTYPDTQVLSRDTGIYSLGRYDVEPYEGYYTSDETIFTTDFNDERLHPKEIVVGIEINNQFKAYPVDDIKEGISRDMFAGKELEITKNKTGEIRIKAEGESLEVIWGFWFSWQAVHPDTQLYE
ncbi:MAG: DUF3179 domain-containing protein [Candidatus Spechtbacterales bacterium]|nr:DUF3179 domain-containing protein [Candidatus Spechtbacterales bacterium]